MILKSRSKHERVKMTGLLKGKNAVFLSVNNEL